VSGGATDDNMKDGEIMLKSENLAEDSRLTTRTLPEREIEDFFNILNLGTVAEREKFLRFAQSSGAPTAVPNNEETLRVCFRDSTATTDPSLT
jgi:hypothetical protein